MSNNLEGLNEVLALEAELHEKLLVAAERKRGAVLEGNLAGLEEILKVEQALIAQVEQAEEKRTALTAVSAAELELASESVKMSDIIAKAPEPFAAKLGKTRQRLRAALDTLRYRTRQNAELLQASLEHVKAFMKMVAEASAPSAEYGSDGRKKAGGVRLLDKSA
jgi:flagellar biosynthesis/type III secretory pathway chaperone